MLASSPVAPLPGATERFVPANGLRLHLVEAGPEDGPPVVLLHGFPEALWYGWRRQIGPLAEAGFRVIVPDQRGYNTSDKPRGVAAYRVETLAADVAGLLDTLQLERASVVGHDWGAVVAWWLALARPERVSRLAILNVPHPAVMRRHLLSSPRQALRSWYVFFFQVPACRSVCWRGTVSRTSPARCAGAAGAAAPTRISRSTARRGHNPAPSPRW